MIMIIDYFYSASLSTITPRRSRLQHGNCIGVLRRSAQATVSEGLAQGPYMATREGVEPMVHDPSVKSHRLYQCATIPYTVSI